MTGHFMLVSTPDSHINLPSRPLPAVHMSVMPDGRPQASIVWPEYRNDILRLSSERGRCQTKNARRPAREVLDAPPGHERGGSLAFAHAGHLATPHSAHPR